MGGRGFGVAGVGAVRALVALLFIVALVRPAAAQSTASFPEPPSDSPTPARPPTPTPTLASPPPSRPTPPSLPTRALEPAPPSNVPPAIAPPALPLAFSPLDAGQLASAPALLPYREGLPVPAGYRVEHRAANGLILAGLSSLLIGYGTALAVGASASFENGTGWLVVPVVGPWAAIGARSYHCDNDPLKAEQCIHGAFSDVQTIAILSADAVVQATGAVLFLAALGSGHDELVRSDLRASLRLTPRAVGLGGFGLGLDARF